MERITILTSEKIWYLVERSIKMTTTAERPNTRKRILDAARELFWLKGYPETSVAEILEKAEANSGSFYYYYKSKEELLLSVLDYYVELLHPEVMDRAFATTPDPIERVFAVLGGYRYALEITGCTFGCPLGRVALEISDIPAAHEKVAINFQGWVSAIESCLEQAGNRLPQGVNRHQLAQFVLTVMEGAVMQARAHRSLEPFDNSVAQLREYFRYLMSTPRIRPKPSS